MKAEERRKKIVTTLTASSTPVTGGALASLLDVSRQIIVQDVAVLKAMGHDIISTHTGYTIHCSPYVERVFKVKHTREETEDELTCIVELGGIVKNVFVWHKVYGRIEASLNIFTHQHIKQFMEGVRSGKSTELMSITGGYHYHTVRAENEEVLQSIADALAQRGYLLSIDLS
jgi:transcriptional regulator of NAD metabolism